MAKIYSANCKKKNNKNKKRNETKQSKNCETWIMFSITELNFERVISVSSFCFQLILVKMRFSTNIRCIILNFLLGYQFCKVASQQCRSEYSVLGMMLRGHIYKTKQTSIPFQCFQACNNDVRCQSFNYVFAKDMCELNDRTKEARPADFVPSSERYYYKRTTKRGKLSYYCRTIRYSMILKLQVYIT